MAVKKNTKSTTSTIDQLNVQYGKIPPQALELEEAVLGAIMLEKDALITVLDILKPDSFYKDANKKIFQAIIDLSTAEKAIDLLTVTDELRKRKELEEIGGPAYIAQLTSKISSAAHIEFHARIIAQKYIQRELIRVSSDIQTRAFDESTDVDDLLDFSEQQLFNIAEGSIKKETQPINILIGQAIEQIQEAGKKADSLSGVPSGFTKLDRMTSGWQNSDLIIVAARPSMGKTAFVLSMARNMAVDHKRAVAIFSLEMSSLQLVNRLIVAETQLPSDKIRTGKLSEEEWRQLDGNIQKLSEAPIFIDDTPAISIYELRAKCRRLKVQHEIGIVIIDYLQLMSGPPDTKGNREQEVSSISRSLKSISKELNVPVIALSQLNRSVETRTGVNKRPMLSDLRESGAIEQDADMVLFIHRPEKYGITEDENNNSLIGIAEIIVAKHRNGAIGDVILRFVDKYAKFEDLDSISPLDDGFDSAPTVTTFSSKMNNESTGKNEFGNNDILSNRGISGSDEAPF
jgi:replicative DNA helicase